MGKKENPELLLTVISALQTGRFGCKSRLCHVLVFDLSKLFNLSDLFPYLGNGDNIHMRQDAVRLKEELSAEH